MKGKECIYRTHRLCIISIILLCIGACEHVAVGGIQGVSEPARAVIPPFAPGEKLTFVLKWGKIPAGKATLEVRSIEEINGEAAYRFVMTARTNSFVDIFFKVRNKIEGMANVAMNRSVYYKAKQREGGYKRDIVVYFDWEKQQAQYSSSNKLKEPISIRPGTFDPLSVLYYVRMNPLEENTNIIRSVTDGKKNIDGNLRVIKRETLKVPAGKFETYKVEPSTEGIGGVFKKSKKAKLHLWLTADERRLPVKIKSKVAVGSFVGELVKIEEPPKTMRAPGVSALTQAAEEE
ncbi:hypothetical protein CSA56_06480 [candidate division KSB3 bacterium]|uniref:DUF3108 domain-containing protein n=1 Tax=candidate division KSB3 bacterium TaxID=2044937 RepID=A0A2G6KHL1_9BACT|nr:MAG: hypothetical protein CSA56_06480 [candidate division KSB3 bacterium]